MPDSSWNETTDESSPLGDAGPVITVRRRTHPGGRYHSTRVQAAGQAVTVYVLASGQITITVDTGTAVKLRHGSGPQTRYGADTAAALPVEADQDDPEPDA